jgi:hypothetical protein
MTSKLNDNTCDTLAPHDFVAAQLRCLLTAVSIRLKRRPNAHGLTSEPVNGYLAGMCLLHKGRRW